MAKKGFSLSPYPWTYHAKFEENQKWSEKFQLKPHKSPEQEAALLDTEYQQLMISRNSFPELPLVNYTSQYGLGCFEGLKAFPWKNGKIKLFRPDQNAIRFASSMKGLKMPQFPESKFISAVKQVVLKNKELGFVPKYDSEWEKNNYLNGRAVYIRPFTYSEPAIGLGLSLNPWVVMMATPVGSYFKPGSKDAVTTNMSRATKNGTGWIKCDANYVIPILAKKQAEADGYMEAIFLDAIKQEYIEEGSSCNIFFVMKDNKIVTPKLGDTILPGITRKSVIQLAKDAGHIVEEREISIKEVLSNAKESFVTGTAAGIAHFESITHKKETATFGKNGIGEIANSLLLELKGIQYGARKDKHNWMVDIS